MKSAEEWVTGLIDLMAKYPNCSNAIQATAIGDLKLRDSNNCATGRAEGMREAAALVRNKFPNITPEQADEGERWQAKLPELITAAIQAGVKLEGA